MIVVDSPVLISLIRNDMTAAARRLREEIDPDQVIIGDLILLEVLQGARDDPHSSALRRRLGRFQSAQMLTEAIAIKAAANSRRLRALGVTIRKTPDLVIGTFCIERGHALLQQDRDFEPMVEHLGLRLA